MSAVGGVGQREAGRSRLFVGLVLILLLAGGTAVLQAVSGIPMAYGNAQFGSASALAAEDTFPTLTDLADGAEADLKRFIPGYTLLGILALLVTYVLRGRQRSDGRALAKISLLLAVGVVADVIETILFRSTVTSLIDGTDATELADQVLFTRVAFVVKFAGLLAALAGLALLIGRRAR